MAITALLDRIDAGWHSEFTNARQSRVGEIAGLSQFTGLSEFKRGGMPMSNPGHLVWIVFAALIGFGSSFIFGDLLNLPVDFYYLVYFAVVITFLFIYTRKTKLDVKDWLLRRPVASILLGLVFGFLMIQNVLSRPETEKFTGTYFVWSIFWRGLVYGGIDGLLLSSFPWIVTWRAFDVREKPWRRKIAFGFLAWLFILVVTTAYHLGYSDFRSKKIIQPNIGNTIISIPTLVTANPIGSPITHAIMHITAVIHCPRTELFLPPHRS